MIDSLEPHLLRRHVRRRSDERALGHGVAARRVARHAEIEHLPHARVPLVQDEVVRLEIAVNDARLANGNERERRVVDELGHACQRQARRLPQMPREVVPAEELHRDVRQPRGAEAGA